MEQDDSVSVKVEEPDSPRHNQESNPFGDHMGTGTCITDFRELK